MANTSVREIIEIDEELCDGCGLCIPNCEEGALAIVDGKLRVLDDALCDGAGACIGHCPQDALRITTRPAVPFDEGLVTESKQGSEGAPHKAPTEAAISESAAFSGAAGPVLLHPSGLTKGSGGCPGSRSMDWNASAPKLAAPPSGPATSALRQWPIQLHLVSPAAPFWEGKELLLAADCVAFAQGGFHGELLDGRSLAIACPKLDDPSGYVEKLAEILATHDVPALRIAIMEVPCCGGLARLAWEAMQRAQYRGEAQLLVVSRFGEVIQKQPIALPWAQAEAAISP